MDIRDLDRRAVESTGAIVARLTDAQLDAPTPCERWTARDVVAHMNDNKRRLLTRLTGGAPEPTGDVRAEFAHLGATLARALADESVLDLPIELLGKPYTVGVALGVHFSDTLVHGWDLGSAIGLDVRLPEDLVAAVSKVMSQFPNDGTIWGPDGLFAEQLSVPEGATPQERMLAFTGRPAQWTPASTS
ncbi:TIGR03086 family metal-binding protein [Actinokineospora inagensis]|uniref:TIGR03086 family metal-binding protein n=1 Tax=Actinokineospora inagensis TaxID=103730 RepID=UPI00047C7808|nr:TIGR03086 family metal-binding protein [Actinokineospora inagensis]